LDKFKLKIRGNFRPSPKLTTGFIFLVVAYFMLFHQLGKASMHLWDESSYALNAQEMVERGNFIEVYLLGKPDLYNSKPPLAIWCMALAIKILGFNEFAVRLPSAIFACLTGLLIMLFVKKETNNNWYGLLAALVLFTSTGYVGWHVTRTADTDAILTFWVTLYVIAAYWVFEKNQNKQSNLLLFFIALTCASLTKGIAGVIGLPGVIGYYFITSPNKFYLFKLPTLYYGLAIFIVAIGGYYLARDYYTEGYLHAVVSNELGGRINRQAALNVVQLPWSYYLKEYAYQNKFFIWFFWFIAGFIVITYKALKGQSKQVYFVWVWLTVMFFLGMSVTKFEWYDAPLFPLMSIILVLGFYHCSLRLNKVYTVVINVLFAASTVFLGIKVIKQNSQYTGDNDLGRFMRHVRGTMHIKQELVFINSGTNFSLFYYLKKDKVEGNRSRESSVYEAFDNGTLIVSVNDDRVKELQLLHETELLSHLNECKMLKIISPH
jgi:4-amino-4-deoxy-L-arabinose transferase-like glycosyltransferase